MLQKRPPIVVILGSIDHGKTTLLDYIRKTNITAKEAGGITQSIGAYEIEHNKQKITFIDTPGHEAFSKMRARGTQIADIAILVVAADDSVQPQTKEIIKILQKTQTPFIVAINKIDKHPDVAKVKNDLTQVNVLLEGYGGNISYQPISAKTGEGVTGLLDLILLSAEMEDLKCDSEKKAEGFILEAKLDSRRGIIATAIITNGTLKIKNEISTADNQGKVKVLENYLGKKIEQASASSPVLILGFETLPKVGEKFFSDLSLFKSSEAKSKIKFFAPLEKMGGPEKKQIKLILKGDVSGSVEALTEVIKSASLLTADQQIKIVSEEIGDISDGDIKLAISTDAIIIGFKVKITKAAKILAREHKIKIIQSDIIYELLKSMEEILSSQQKIIGRLEILAVFGRKGKNQIIGGRVTEGEIKTNSVLQINRGGGNIGQGKIINLQQNKKDVIKIEAKNECGVLFNSEIEVKIGDILIL